MLTTIKQQLALSILKDTKFTPREKEVLLLSCIEGWDDREFEEYTGRQSFFFGIAGIKPDKVITHEWDEIISIWRDRSTASLEDVWVFDVMQLQRL